LGLGRSISIAPRYAYIVLLQQLEQISRDRGPRAQQPQPNTWKPQTSNTASRDNPFPESYLIKTYARQLECPSDFLQSETTVIRVYRRCRCHVTFVPLIKLPKLLSATRIEGCLFTRKPEIFMSELAVIYTLEVEDHAKWPGPTQMANGDEDLGFCIRVLCHTGTLIDRRSLKSSTEIVPAEGHVCF
jgi:hypothetical protein